jgi:hypothetical protein
MVTLTPLVNVEFGYLVCLRTAGVNDTNGQFEQSMGASMNRVLLPARQAT